MKISDEGLRLIKSFEGYHTRLDDGRCKTYRCPANVLTIGWGCTEGVHEGMIWTEAEAEAALRRELAKFEAGVIQAVTVPMNQNQFDALVSLAYNIGLGALRGSSVLKAVNKEDWTGAAKAFQLWNKGGGKVLPGLVSRRSREAALLLKPTEAPSAPYMPQKVSKQIEVKPPAVAATGAAVGAGAVSAGSVLPAVPPPPDLSWLSQWQGFGDTVSNGLSWVSSNPIIAAACAAWIGIAWFAPALLDAAKRRLAAWQS